MLKKAIIKDYIDNGKTLIPLKDNIPLNKNWRNRTYDDNYLYEYKDNLGWVLSYEDLIIDVDPRNNGDVSVDKLKKECKIDLTSTVKTPRGGFHIYLSLSSPPLGCKYSIKKNLKDYPGIDFLSEGCYVVITGSKRKFGEYKWDETLFNCFEQNEAPNSLLQLIVKERISKTKEDLGDFEGLLGDNSSTTEEDIREMLSKLDPSMVNDEWVKVGMACHNWDPVFGLNLWEEWSRDGENYKEGETAKRWRSFRTGDGVTLGTVNHMIKEVVYDDVKQIINKYLERIKYADEKTLDLDIIPALKKENLSKIDVEKIAKSMQDRYKVINNIKLPISQIRQSLNNTSFKIDKIDEEAPYWCKEWVYVNSHNCFANLETFKILKPEAFNIINGKYVITSDSGAKQSATKYVSDNGFVNLVDSLAYIPYTTDRICEEGDSKVLNTFNINTVPLEADSYSKKGKEAIELIKKHIRFIFTTEENCRIFTQWLAHQVQYPGRQILWAPVIQSIQGVGKSFFAELLRCCLGDSNVGTVSPSQVISDFNGWASGSIVNVLEELRVKGHNRHEAVNCLKPLITDRMIQINDKGVKQYMTYNNTNYICFTNYKDSLPLDQDDRRWWVIFVPVENLQDIKNHIGEDPSTYFPRLFSAVRQHGREVRRWLAEYKISKEFMNIKQAPMTSYKMSMIATEQASSEGYSEIKELIEEGGRYFNQEVVSSSDLFDALAFKYSDLDLTTNKKNLVLKKLGYSLNSKPVKIDGKTRRIWTKNVIDNDKIRELLTKQL